MGARGSHEAAASLLVGVALLATSSAAACTCEPMTPAEGLASATYVFVGKVIHEELPLVKRRVAPEGRQVVTADWTRWDLIVSRAWKGAPPDTVSVYSGLSLSCGIRLEVGQEFIVYGWVNEGPAGHYSNWPEGTQFPVIFTGACSRTMLLERAAEDLSYLGESTWKPLQRGNTSPPTKEED